MMLSKLAWSSRGKTTPKPSRSVMDTLRLVPSRFLPVYLLVFFQSRPTELQLDKARYLGEQQSRQIFPTGSDDSRKELTKPDVITCNI